MAGDVVTAHFPRRRLIQIVATNIFRYLFRGAARSWFRNIGSLLSEGDSHGTWQRFIIITTPTGPDSESGPSAKPANGPTPSNHLHANPYPNTAAPGQAHECEAGNEPYLVGKTIVGNVPGNQGVVTSGQPGAPK